jgi:antirestriction protein ArdC
LQRVKRIAFGARLRHHTFWVRRLRDRRTRELGAAFLCADLDLTLEPREDHAAYIANWLDVLKADNRAIFTAASHAQRAAELINGLQPAASAG